MNITEMAESDCAAAADVVLSSFVCAALRDHLPAEAITAFVQNIGSEEAIRARLGDCRFIIAWLDDEIVGIAATRDDQLTYLFVTPINQRCGIGAQLFRAAEKTIATAGHKALGLIAIFPSSVPFFETMGLSESGKCEVQLGPNVSVVGVTMHKQVV